MNQRIQELAEQAKAESSQWLGSKPATTITYDELEKFAELIVRECTAVSRKSSKRIDDMGSLIAQDIEKHFEIE